MTKAPDAFRTISEVAAELDLPQHVLRFWESRFPQIKPMKRGGGRRYYRPDDVELLRGIRHLLYGQGYTIRGVQRILREQGPRFVQGVWQEGAPQPEYAADQDAGEGERDGEVEVTEAEAETPDDGEEQVAPTEPAPAPRVELRLEPRFEPVPEAEPSAPEETRREPIFAPVAPVDLEAGGEVEPLETPIQFATESDAGNGHDRPLAPEPEPEPEPVSAPAPVVQMIGLSESDRERLVGALEELFECRRLLDSALVDAEPEA